MKRITRSVFCVYTFYAAMCSYSQAVLTANETVSAYENSLRFGINLGAPKGLWTDQAQAVLAAGSKNPGVPLLKS